MATAWTDAARRPAAFVVAVLLAGLCIAAGTLLGACARLPADDSAEAGFARDMATHHAQAVDMSLLVRDETTDAELRALISDIIVTQSTQRGVFMGWLQQWGVPQASGGARMAWMPGHAHMPTGGGPVLMHGMATDAELQRLQHATGVDAEIQFLQLMIRHHEGGVLMARAVLDLSRRPEVVQMAKSIDEGQRGEILQMQALLAARGGKPLPSLLVE